VVEAPGQIERLPVMTGLVGTSRAVVVTEAEVAEQLLAAFFTVTVKVPDVLTEMLCVVAPFDHR
jgi:hypothetical protein